MAFFRWWFSPYGRINRIGYALSNLTLLTMSIFLAFIILGLAPEPGDTYTLEMILGGAVVFEGLLYWSGWVLAIKRTRDANLNTGWAALTLLPIVGWCAVLFFGILRTSSSTTLKQDFFTPL